MKKYVSVVAVLILCLTACARGEDTEVIKLGSPYIDPVRGFELRPPVNTTCSRVVSANKLVTWTRRRSPKAPILWSLSVYTRTDKKFKPGGNLLTYGRDLAARLAKTERFKAAPPRLIDLAGTKAVNLRGTTAGKAKFWQRRVWVYLRGSNFLEIRLSGPVSNREKLDTIASAVLKTLKIVDPKDTQKLRKAALARGTELLKAFSDKKITGVLDTTAQWFLFSRDKKVIGFMRQTEEPSSSSVKSGCRIKSWIVMNFDGKALKLHREMFTTADRSVETWVEIASMKSPGRTVSMKEKGSKSDAIIKCEITAGKQKQTQKPVNPPKDNYLPRAMAWLLRRMVNLKTPASYAFATYNGQTGRFNLRTFSVVGPDEIESAGRKVNAIRVTDQLTSETQAADMWVDMDGKLLIMKTDDGLVMEAASNQAVLRRFPKAQKTIKTMGK